MAGLTDAVRRAIRLSGQTRYRIAKETGIAQSQLSRLMTGETGLSVESIEKLADYLGLEIVMRPRRRRTKKG
jgi:transcriptional regulator with XRE-family HTH domain